jgi:carbonic anhydrase
MLQGTNLRGVGARRVQRSWLAAAGFLSACRTTAAIEPPPAAPEPTAAPSARPVDWHYEGELGPAHWAELSPAYVACGQAGQSPIDLVQTRASTGSWQADYHPSGLRIAHHENVTDILDNGHTIQVTVDAGSVLTTERGRYALKQFHFHTPSEHTLGGRAFPMEVHFVHQSAEGNFAVLAVLFEEGAENANLATLIAHFPEKGHPNLDPAVRVELALHLPRNHSAYSYVGSFTTPPCTTNVEWLVVTTPVAASAAQLAAFAARLNHNNRPIQPSGGREVTISYVGEQASD